MKSIDNIKDFNDLIIELQAQLNNNRLQKELLIREAFALWYVLVEGINCENFSENEVEHLLKKNYDAFNTEFANDADYNFIIGWMMDIAFWYFELSVEEGYGKHLLLKAYKSNPKNSLFKWAIRNEINLSSEEVKNLKIDICLRLDQLYNYGILIKEYFLSIINASIS